MLKFHAPNGNNIDGWIQNVMKEAMESMLGQNPAWQLIYADNDEVSMIHDEETSRFVVFATRLEADQKDQPADTPAWTDAGTDQLLSFSLEDMISALLGTCDSGETYKDYVLGRAPEDVERGMDSLQKAIARMQEVYDNVSTASIEALTQDEYP